MAELKGLKESLRKAIEEVATASLADLRSEIYTLKSELEGLKDRLNAIDIESISATLEQRIERARSEISELRKDIGTMKSQIALFDIKALEAGFEQRLSAINSTVQASLARNRELIERLESEAARIRLRLGEIGAVGQELRQFDLAGLGRELSSIKARLGALETKVRPEGADLLRALEQKIGDLERQIEVIRAITPQVIE